jgi:hypothetical protein
VTTPVDNKMFELMQTPSLMSRHISVNKVSRDRQDWSDLSSNRMSSASGRSSLDYNKVQEFLRTPSISSKASSVWSSYDVIVTHLVLTKLLTGLSDILTFACNVTSTVYKESTILHNEELLVVCEINPLRVCIFLPNPSTSYLRQN